jgi:hypothetical protein
MRSLKGFTKDALAYLLEAAEECVEFSYVVQRYSTAIALGDPDKLNRILRWRKRRRDYERLQYLRKNRLVNLERIGENIRTSLTAKGRLKLLKMRVLAAPRLSDGQRVYVSFDFPNPQRKARDAFRRFLKRHGFSKLQQSLWVSGRDVSTIIREFAESTGADDWIKILIAKQVS